MSYRSIKRVLRKPSLERKCLLLFAVCLLILIGGSFWWYGTATERIINDNNRDAGHHLANAAMQQYHFREWEQVNAEGADPKFAAAVSSMYVDLEFEW